ncbi:MAG: poly(3-hydroxybutyrate) depolymerase, partial [Flavitalea sp.]
MKLALFVLFLAEFHGNVFSQMVSDSFEVDGHYRSFHYRAPAPVSKRASLVFVLHGSDGEGLEMVKHSTKLALEAEAENFILVYPDGYKRFWNECRKNAQSAANLENINEAGFFSGMISYFEKRFDIDTKNVFAVGASGGGHMAYKLALTMPHQFRAITALIANLPDTSNFDCIAANVAIPVMIVNGTLDPTNIYTGGPVIMADGMNLGLVRSTDRTFHYWASLAGYKGEPRKSLLPDTDPADGKTIERYEYRKKG